ncbi:HIV Tat-specific factor 1 [Fistulifera solaris]|uniref:HIV Tat-specific factor 1 n=1 Tax=Fistulifera solaris TaxID=1519565 RepID=A0A1Z5K1W8_FISSO|nr:HIV Tat-specific factor 1 [Fistulifera solaris]|eukprot:GAX20280.1 HIV Tat-specific factor 1 [Fistulifera solaris]
MERRERDNEVNLDTHWLYQNPTTGQPSQHPLTTRQICLLLSKTVLTPETQLLQVLPDQTYASEWRIARSVSIVRCIVEPWYYESSSSTTQGPISCAQLAELFYQEASVIVPTTRVYSQLTNTWKCIQGDAELQMALEVFYPERMHPVDPPTEAQKELEAFLSPTERMGSSTNQDDDASYESDHGTRYVKDYRTGKWIHEALMPTRKEKEEQCAEEVEATTQPKKKKQKKAQFAARNARCWIYITGLPLDTTEEQLAQIFVKAGILDLDPTTQRPKIKVYRHKEDHPFAGQCKGDASLCYARPESVALALTLLDETEYSPGHRMKVQPAQFEQKGELHSRNRISNAQRKVAKLAALQARDWDDSNSRLVGGRKGLRIIVLKHLFEPNVWKDEVQEDVFFAELERSLRAELEVLGVVEKITVFSQRAVVVVKFTQPSAASAVVKDWDGKLWNGRRVEAMYWDGVTDFTVRDEEKEQVETEQRLEEFGNWLDEQELPEELQLQKE